MKLAFSKPSANNAERDLLFKNYGKIGYKGLQLKNGQYAPYLDAPEKFTAEWGNYPGISSGVIMGGGIDSDAKESIIKMAKFSQKIGAEMLIYCMGIPREGLSGKQIKQYGAQFNEIGKEVEEFGIKLTLHNHYDSPVMYREDIDWFFDCENLNVGLTVDTAHFVKSGVTDIAEIIRSFTRIIDNYHIKDIKNGEFVVLGQGIINFDTIFNGIRESGYNGWVSTDEESGCEMLESMQLCYSFLTRNLTQ